RFAWVAAAYRQARAYPSAKTDYDQRLAEWTAAQQDSENAVYQNPAPIKPAVPSTRDDNQKFTMSVEQAQSHLRRLAKSALSAFDAEAQIPVYQKSQELESAYMRGWALFLMRETDDKGLLGGPYKENGAEALRAGKPLMADKDFIDCFRRCTELAPDDPDNW